MSIYILKLIFIIFTLPNLTHHQEVLVNSNNYLTISLIDKKNILFTWRYTSPFNSSWVSIGIGGNIMEKVDVHYIKWNGKGNFTLGDFWSEDYSFPSEDSLLGGKNDLKIETSFLNSDSHLIVKYSRKLKTNDTYDNEIVNGKNALVTAWSPLDPSMTIHGSYVGVGSFIVDTNSLTVKSTIGRLSVWEVHGLFLLFSWCIVNSVGYASIRLFGYSKIMTWIHRLCGFITTIGTIVLTSLAITNSVEGPKNDYASLSIHTIAGYITLGISCLLLVTGILNGVLVYGRVLSNDNLLKFKKIHKFIGHLMTYTVILLCMTGGWLLYQEYTLVIIICSICLSSILIIDMLVNTFEMNKRIKLLKNDSQFTLKMKKYSVEEVRKMENQGKEKFVLMDNYLVDVKDYFDQHPGGMNLIEDNLYKDVSRYMIGSVPYNSKFPSVDHKYLTCLYAVKSLAIGEISEEHMIIKDVKSNKSLYINTEINEIKLRKVAESTSEFSIFFKDNPYTFTRYMKGFSWMGRHFSITSKRKNITRLYSLCLSANKEIHDKHIVLIDNIDVLEKKNQPNKVILSSKEVNSNYLQVYIKKYNTPNALSLYLHSSIINFSDISVKGPLGLGLNIDDKQELSKTYISFAAGTGIYCFLDFISYAIRLLCYKVAKE